MKVCTECKVEKSLEDFHRNKSKKDGRHHKCKPCSKMYYKKWQDQKPETRRRHLDWKLLKQKEARDYIVEYLLQHSCVDCGMNDIRTLVFDHVRGVKHEGVMTMASRGNSLESIKQEIAKCQVRCHNCHSIITAERGDWWLSRIT